MLKEAAAFYVYLRAYCRQTHASVTSFGRTHDHNAKVGGVADSPHLQWLGCDVVYDAPAMPLEERRKLAQAWDLEIVAESDHDHIQPRGWGAGER